MGQRERKRGHDYERDVVNELLRRGWEAATSRYTSRKLDDEGVDINSNFPYLIQCKAVVNMVGLMDIFETTAANVVFWRKMKHKGDKFYKEAELVILSQEDFLNLVDKAYNNLKKQEK